MISGDSARQFLRDLKAEMGRDNITQGAAALGYYLTLAMFPGVILLMTIVPFLPLDGVDEAIMDLLGQVMPNQAYTMVEDVVEGVTNDRRGGLLSFGLIGSLWATTIGMYAVMRQLNITYNVKEGRSFIRTWGTALLLSFMFGVLVVGAFSLIVTGGIIEDWLGSRFGFSDLLLTSFALLRWVIIVAAMLLGFAMIYHIAPNVEQKFSFITPGSALGVVLLIGASLLFSLYTKNFAVYDAIYGSIGAMIVLMLWLYIAGLVILLGSEINALLEHRSPKGKTKGEKREGAHPGGRLSGSDQGA